MLGKKNAMSTIASYDLVVDAAQDSLGVVTTKKSLDYIELVRCADLAMYRAKGQGKNSAVVLEV